MVQVGFNLPVKESSLASGAFKVECDSGACTTDAVGVATSADTNVVTFDLDEDYEASSTYRVTIDSALVEALDGKKMQTDETWTFDTGTTTDDIPPTVASVKPLGVDVCLSSYVRATFSEAMDVRTFSQAESLALDTTDFPDDYTDDVATVRTSEFGPKDMMAYPRAYLDPNDTYYALLQSNRLRDACLNYLDGDGDGFAAHPRGTDQTWQAGDDIDDYAWSFDTGENPMCVPEISSFGGADYYHYQASEYLSIFGDYFSYLAFGTPAIEVKFNDQVTANGPYCIESTNKLAEGQDCPISHNLIEIKTLIPASGGNSAGAIDGNITVTNRGVDGQDLTSAGVPKDIKSPHLDQLSPDRGGVDQFISLWGSEFGASQGINDKVYFKNVFDPSVQHEATYPCDSGHGWNDDYVIIAVPEEIEGAVPGNDDWYIQVVIDEGGADKWGNMRMFTFDGSDPTPGLCYAENITKPSYLNKGEFDPETGLGDRIEIGGVRFEDVSVQGRGIRFGDHDNFVETGNNNFTSTAGDSDKAETDVPNVQSASRIGVYLVTDPSFSSSGVASNPVPFEVINLGEAGPYISGLSPDFGPQGQYITIMGSNFGTEVEGLSKVYLTDIYDNVIFSFPDECKAGYWRDNYIIFKVPDIGSGSPWSSVGPAPATLTVKVERSDGEVSNAVDFYDCVEGTSFCSVHTLLSETACLAAGEVWNDCVLNPGLCAMRPDNGPAGLASVNLYGERLGESQGTDNVKFIDSSSVDFTDVVFELPWTDQNIGYDVPEGYCSDAAYTTESACDTAGETWTPVQEGGALVSVLRTMGESNALPFTVGHCEDIGCLGGLFCCPEGVCQATVDDCIGTDNKSYFAWEFTTAAFSGSCIDQGLVDCDTAGGYPYCCTPSTFAQFGCDAAQKNCSDCDIVPNTYECFEDTDGDGVYDPGSSGTFDPSVEDDPDAYVCCDVPCVAGLCPTVGSTCSGRTYAMCLETTYCPNQPGNCQEVVDISKGSCDCSALYPGSVYDSDFNRCKLAADFCDLQERRTIGLEDYIFTCRGGKWQTPKPTTAPMKCPGTTMLDVGDQCTLLAETCDDSCPTDYVCKDQDDDILTIDAVCYSEDTICPSGSTCSGASDWE